MTAAPGVAVTYGPIELLIKARPVLILVGLVFFIAAGQVSPPAAGVQPVVGMVAIVAGGVPLGMIGVLIAIAAAAAIGILLGEVAFRRLDKVSKSWHIRTFRGKPIAMVTRTRTRLYSGRATAGRTGRRAARSTPMRFLARAGFVARGLMYIVIGWIALQIAFGKTSQEANRTGALHELSAKPFAAAVLWLLVVGFFGMALWRLSEAAYGPAAGGRKTTARLASLARAVIYAVTGYGVLRYVIGAGAPQSSNQQSRDLTAALLRHAGGQALVVIIGLAFIGGGLYLGYQAWRERFRRELEFGRLRARTRRIVEWLGKAGGIARGIVFVTAGVFLIVAAAEYKPQQAKGVDSSLRALAATPAGPWLLVLVAIGLVMFGLFSWCQARWQRL